MVKLLKPRKIKWNPTGNKPKTKDLYIYIYIFEKFSNFFFISLNWIWSTKSLPNGRSKLSFGGKGKKKIYLGYSV